MPFTILRLLYLRAPWKSSYFEYGLTQVGYRLSIPWISYRYYSIPCWWFRPTPPKEELVSWDSDIFPHFEWKTHDPNQHPDLVYPKYSCCLPPLLNPHRFRGSVLIPLSSLFAGYGSRISHTGSRWSPIYLVVKPPRIITQGFWKHKKTYHTYA